MVQKYGVPTLSFIFYFYFVCVFSFLFSFECWSVVVEPFPYWPNVEFLNNCFVLKFGFTILAVMKHVDKVMLVCFTAFTKPFEAGMHNN